MKVNGTAVTRSLKFFISHLYNSMKFCPKICFVLQDLRRDSREVTELFDDPSDTRNNLPVESVNVIFFVKCKQVFN